METGSKPGDDAARLAQRRAETTAIVLALRFFTIGVELTAFVAVGVASIAIMADSVHLLIEAGGDVAVMLAFAGARARLTHEQADRWVQHVMIFGGFVVGVSSAGLAHGHELDGGRVVYTAAIVSTLVNAGATWLLWRVCRGHGGTALWRQMLHYGIDASFGPLALLASGLAGALGWHWADPVAGVLIGGLMILAALLPHEHDAHDHSPISPKGDRWPHQQSDAGRHRSAVQGPVADARSARADH